jgi:hypothetical protein
VIFLNEDEELLMKLYNSFSSADSFLSNSMESGDAAANLTIFPILDVTKEFRETNMDSFSFSFNLSM